MVFRKSLNKELTFTCIGVFVVLFSILLTTQTINLLGRAAQGRIASDAVFALVGFWSLGFYPVILILTIFISVMVVLTRIWKDHEMVVWMSSGLSLKNWIWPVLRFALPFTLLIAIGTTVIEPWAQYRSKEYAEILKQKEDISALSPGVFKETGSGNRIYFIEKYDPVTGAAQNIFVQSTEKNQVATIFSQSGDVTVNDKGERILALHNGRRYIGEAGQGNFEIAEFSKYTLKIGQAPKLIGPVSESGTRSTLALLKSNVPGDKAELAWRFSLPLSSIILALLAIPLSYNSPRSGHAYNLVFALLAYLVYQNGLWLLRDWIARDKLSSAFGILPIHLLMLFIAIALLAYRSYPSGYVTAYFKQKKDLKA